MVRYLHDEQLFAVAQRKYTYIYGNGGVEVSASVLPCRSCNGVDGRGKPEGGVTPSDLTWAALTKPYGVDHPSGRRHPPYTEALLKRAITMGLDSAGNELGTPRK